MTSVLAKALTSLYNLIKQDAHTLNKASTQRLQRHVQKLANAAQVSFAKRALLRDQSQFLHYINNKAKVRRLTWSVVLKKAKVISYKDIEKARAKRAAKEVIKGKGKQGEKRKSATLETDKPESEPEMACAAKEVIKGKEERGRKRKNAVLEADEPESELEPEPEPEVARAAKEVIKGRGKRGRKRKSAVLESDKLTLEPEPEPEVARMIEKPEL
jgi:hypothetical protein